MNNIPLRFPILPAGQYLTVLDATSHQVRSRLMKPVWGQFDTKGVSPYPRWFMALILVSLIAVLIFSFFVSAGKQVAAMGLLLDHLPDKFGHLSPFWANASIAFTLFLSELGTVLFLVAAGTLGARGSKVKVGRHSINPGRIILSCFAGLCATYAIVANTTITALDMIREAIVLQWLVAIGVPTIVLGLGMILERMIVEHLKSGSDARLRYEQAQSEYEAYHADPTTHPAYPMILADLLYQEMLKIRSVGGIIKQMVDSDPRYKRLLVSAEYKIQQEAGRIDLSVDVSELLSDTPVISVPARVSNGVSKPVSTDKIQRDPDAMKKALAYLQAHGKNGMSVRDLATAAGVSHPTMQRAVKQFEGGSTE